MFHEYRRHELARLHTVYLTQRNPRPSILSTHLRLATKIADYRFMLTAIAVPPVSPRFPSSGRALVPFWFMSRGKRGNFFPGLSLKLEAGRKNRMGAERLGGYDFGCDDAAICGRRRGRFYLAKDARRGEPTSESMVGSQEGQTDDMVAFRGIV